MSDKIGEMAWLDLTVDNATEVKNFYQRVIGWQVENVAMGDYNDYVMKSPDSGEAVSGICHAKVVNASMPATWLPYFLVKDINDAVANVIELGGELLTEIK
jgi:predicted enzyme related to lactoylglutathione lyase